MAHEKDGTALARYGFHLRQALLLEGRVPHGQHLVDYQDLRLQMGGQREGEAHVHPARIVFDRGVDEAVHLGESNNPIELTVHLGPPHPEDRAVEVDVFAAGEFGVEATAVPFS